VTVIPDWDDSDMCFICDGGTHEELQDRIGCSIERKGWYVAGVEKPGGRLDWAYTIGLSERFDHPELVVTGRACWDCAVDMLDKAARQVAAGRRLDVGDSLALFPGAARAGAVHPEQWAGDRFAQWWRYYGGVGAPPEARALQLIWLDDDGTWQDDARRPRRWSRERLDQTPGTGLTSRTGGPPTKRRRSHRRRARR
jgi:hypothetical protein